MAPRQRHCPLQRQGTSERTASYSSLMRDRLAVVAQGGGEPTPCWNFSRGDGVALQRVQPGSTSAPYGQFSTLLKVAK